MSSKPYDNSTTTPSTNATAQEPVFALLAEFDDVDSVMLAAEKVRDAGFHVWDVHSSFPIHGMPRAMGLRPTIIPWIALAHGVFGLVLGLLLVWWTNAKTIPGIPTELQGYEFFISGKPRFSLPANIPIMFELAVLFAAFGTLLAMLGLNKLPMLSNPLFKSHRFRGATTDKFVLVIESHDPQFQIESTRAFLQSLNPTAIEVVTDPAGKSEPSLGYTDPKDGYQNERFPIPTPWRLKRELHLQRPPAWLVAMVVIITVTCLASLTFMIRSVGATSSRPRLHMIQDMGVQPRYGAQSAAEMFADGRSIRPAVAGTIRQGSLKEDAHFDLGYTIHTQSDGRSTLDFFTGFPAQISDDSNLLEYGRNRFGIYCAPCHGLKGDGTGPVNQTAVLNKEAKWVAASNLLSQTVCDRADGHLYNTIRKGIRNMPPYGVQLDARDRWAVVAWVRQLQKQTPEAVPDPTQVAPGEKSITSQQAASQPSQGGRP